MEADNLIHLDPAKIQVTENLRYAQLKADVEDLKGQIAEAGGVLTPIEVEPIEPVNGYTYRLTVGHRRHQAVVELNKTGAGLTLPAIVRPLSDPLDRLKRQLSENLHRKNLSPMDQAIVIDKLFAAGVTRNVIREMLPRQGRQKGGLTPASNAWVNMTRSFLELPKDMRDKIHDGRIGVAAAYELTKVAPEKRDAVLARAETEREKEVRREDADEKKYIEAEARLAEATKAKEDVVIKLDHAKAEKELAEKAHAEKVRLAMEAFQKAKHAQKPEDKKAAQESFKALETDAAVVEKQVTSAQKELDKLEATHKKLTEAAEQNRQKLAQARKDAAKPAAKKGKAIGAANVQKAAKAEGADGGRVKLTAAEMRKTIEELALPGTYPKVAQIGQAILDCFNSVGTPGTMLKKLAVITGELQVPEKKKK